VTTVPTFDSPRPVTVRIDLPAGSVRIRGEERTTTSVDVRPDDPGNDAAVRAAEQTRVSFADGNLLVTGPRRPRLLFFGGSAAISVEVLVPTGSSVEVTATAGDVTCEGTLGDVRTATRYGELRVDRAASARLRTSAGDVGIVEVTGAADVSTAYGGIRVGRATGDVRLDTAYGDVAVDLAEGSVSAATRYGRLHLGQVVRGSVTVESAYGDIEVGVREGTAAWLDASAGSGRVRNLLTASEGPEDAGDTVEIRARTGHGDVVVRRG
jgi:DUF4097 and DUF4098 domain-containing protein YvlB